MSEVSPFLSRQEAKRVIEAALICSAQPLTLQQLSLLFEDAVGPDTIRAVLDDLVRDWADRGAELVRLEAGWRLQSRESMAPFLDKLAPARTPRYSRATLETLAVIAFRQPVTRADIEEWRGVGVSRAVLKPLEDRGWIEVVGRREAPGQPALWATTPKLLQDLGLKSLEELENFDPALLEGTLQSPASMPAAQAP